MSARPRGPRASRPQSVLVVACAAALACTALVQPVKASSARDANTAPPHILLATGRTEPALVVDPRDGNHVIAAANPDYYHPARGAPLNGTFFSDDGGTSWHASAAPTYGAFSGVADPSLALDAAGRIYYLSMGETPAYCGEAGNAALVLTRSGDFGRTYGPAVAVDVNSSDDKPFLAAATVGSRSDVYASFTRWLSPNREILFTRSTDGGATFDTPRVLYASHGVNMGSLPLPGPHGRVSVVWAHYDISSFYPPIPTRIMVRTSTDEGRTFDPPVTIASFTGLPRLVMPGALRVFTFPTAAVSPRNGTLYVAWVQARVMPHPAYSGEMDADVVIARSHDGGRTWSPPAVLNDVAAGDRFMPALTVDRAGLLHIAFYDRRADHTHFGLYSVTVRDLGDRLRVWPNRRVNAALSSPYVAHYIAPGSSCVAPGRFIGDYIAAASVPNGDLDVAWTDTARNIVEETDLWFARVPAGYLQSGKARLATWDRR